MSSIRSSQAEETTKRRERRQKQKLAAENGDQNAVLQRTRQNYAKEARRLAAQDAAQARHEADVIYKLWCMFDTQNSAEYVQAQRAASHVQAQEAASVARKTPSELLSTYISEYKAMLPEMQVLLHRPCSRCAYGMQQRLHTCRQFVLRMKPPLLTSTQWAPYQKLQQNSPIQLSLLKQMRGSIQSPTYDILCTECSDIVSAQQQPQQKRLAQQTCI